MARKTRKISLTNTYHVMLRGINHQQIFEDDMDYSHFIEILRLVISISDSTLYAFCLMGNHIHLLIKTDEESIDLVMKRLETRFVIWYNKKYKRSGNLFEGRYRSEVVETDSYFLTALRYILQNPVKAGMCNNIYEYPWSSASYSSIYTNSFINLTKARSYFKNNKEFHSFLNANNSDKCLENVPKTFYSDKDIQQLIYNFSNCSNISEFQKIDIVSRNNCIFYLLSLNVSIRQISRLSGLSKSQIYRIGKLVG